MSLSSGSEFALDAATASRFAQIALSHVRREYPNVIAHAPPKSVHPIFYGSFDWHSCVHSYWLLATIRRCFPESEESPRIVALFEEAFTKEAISSEVSYLERATARGFERPYGWAWFLMLEAELLRHETDFAARLKPLAQLFAERFAGYLPKATYPIRSGVHSNTAFALSLAREYASAADESLLDKIDERARDWYFADRDCQAWEPSGEDFLSPALAEAECMRRCLPSTEYPAWLAGFLPRLAQGEPKTLFAPVHVSDRSDGRIVHLEGLNLSRAWCWRSIASALPKGDPVRAIAGRAAASHLAASLPHVSGDYMGEHWLASFALLALLAPEAGRFRMTAKPARKSS
jgi:Protein of unknown function (DUF2891)